MDRSQFKLPNDTGSAKKVFRATILPPVAGEGGDERLSQAVAFETRLGTGKDLLGKPVKTEPVLGFRLQVT